MKKEMIYLFNSAYRQNYSQNVVRTLFLPNGWTNEYRYRFNSEHPNIDPTKVDEFLNSRKTEVLIIFIDRFNEGKYLYHPLRKGNIKRVYKDGGRLFFNVELQDFISPINNAEFNAQLINIGNLPKLTNNDSRKDNDGFYAIKNNSLIEDKANFKFGENAWDKITDDIKNTEAFSATETKETLFARISIHSNYWFFKNKKPKNKTSSFFRITKGQEYQINFFYKYPNQTGNKILNLEINHSNSIKLLSANKYVIDNYTNNTKIIFISKKYIEDLNDSIEFKFSSTNITEPDKLIAPNYTIPLKIKEGLSFWIQLFFAIILFVLSEIIFSIDLSKMKEISVSEILNEFTIIKILGTSLKAIALFWIFRIVGKKLL